MHIGTVDGRHTEQAFLRDGLVVWEASVRIHIRVPAEAAVHRDGFGSQREREDLVCDHEEICACLCHGITSFQWFGKLFPYYSCFLECFGGYF